MDNSRGKTPYLVWRLVDRIMHRLVTIEPDRPSCHEEDFQVSGSTDRKLIVVLVKSQRSAVTATGHSFHCFHTSLAIIHLRSECVIVSASCPHKGQLKYLFCSNLPLLEKHYCRFSKQIYGFWGNF